MPQPFTRPHQWVIRSFTIFQEHVFTTTATSGTVSKKLSKLVAVFWAHVVDKEHGDTLAVDVQLF